MDESFEDRPLFDRETLRELQRRSDGPSALRLTLHLGVFAAGVALVVLSPSAWLQLLAALPLAPIWASLFAPFHECIHRTAFRSRRLNALGAWLTGIPFGMAPAVYRAFHFEHHRYTQDPTRDPEIAAAPELLSPWPRNRRSWLLLASGFSYLMLKLRLMLRFSFRPASGWDFAPWARKEHERIAWESRAVAICWVALPVALLAGWAPAAGLLLALTLSHPVFALWVSTEHRGLPHEGSMLARTRAIRSHRVVRWFIWNMNYHAEHHGWPSIPWHRLPEAHGRVADELEHGATGYLGVHRSVWRGLPRASDQPI